MKNEQLAKEFMDYISIHYKKILSGFQKSSFKQDITSDLFHDSLIKIFDNINEKGIYIKDYNYSGKSFENVLFITCCNEVLQKKRLLKNKGYNLSFDSDDVFENHCYIKGDYEYNFGEELKVEGEKISEDLLVDDIRKYINKKHSMLDVGIFEFYFRSGLSFAKIAELTGYSTRTIFLKVNKLKADIITNFADKRLSHRIIIKEKTEKIKFKKIKDDDIEEFYK